MKVREEALSSILEKCYAVLDNLLTTQTCILKHPSGSSRDAVQCRSMILGSLLSGLINCGLYPERETGATLNMSVRKLRSKLLNIHIQMYDSHDYAEIVTYADRRDNYGSFRSVPKDRNSFLEHGIYPHTECGEQIMFATITNSIVGQMPSPVLECHRMHMEAQSKKGTQSKPCT